MPGLTLTLPQAARLFSLEPARCERILDALVHAGLLVRYRGFTRGPIAAAAACKAAAVPLTTQGVRPYVESPLTRRADRGRLG